MKVSSIRWSRNSANAPAESTATTSASTPWWRGAGPASSTSPGAVVLVCATGTPRREGSGRVSARGHQREVPDALGGRIHRPRVGSRGRALAVEKPVVYLARLLVAVEPVVVDAQ